MTTGMENGEVIGWTAQGVGAQVSPPTTHHSTQVVLLNVLSLAILQQQRTQKHARTPTASTVSTLAPAPSSSCTMAQSPESAARRRAVRPACERKWQPANSNVC